jgi:hypothetical protein
LFSTLNALDYVVKDILDDLDDLSILVEVVKDLLDDLDGLSALSLFDDLDDLSALGLFDDLDGLSALVEVVKGLLDDLDCVLADVLPLPEAGHHLLVHVALDQVVGPLLCGVQLFLHLKKHIFFHFTF